MKKRILCILLSCIMVLSLCGCGMGTDFTGGSPWIDSDIEENVKNNYDTDLKDDFALANNKDWILENPIEAGEGYNKRIFAFKKELKSRLIGIAKDDTYTDNHDADLVATIFNSFLDWDARDAAGVEPLKPYLEDINNIDSLEDLYKYSSAAKMTFADLYSWNISVSPEDSTKKIITFYSPEVFLADAADYKKLKKMDSYTKLIYNSQKNTVEAVLLKCGYSKKEIKTIFKNSIELEKLISEYCYTNDDWYLTETTDVINSQLHTVDELSNYPGIDVYLNNIENWGITDVSQVQFYEKIDYFEHLDAIYNEDNIELIKDYLIAHTAASSIILLDKELFYKYMDINNNLSGASGYKSEDEIAISVVTSLLGWPLSKLYCEKYVTEEDKKNVYNVITDIIDEYKVMLSEEDFLSEETKARAIEKLDNMSIKCLYPDKWEDYSNLELEGSYLDMSLEISSFELERNIEKFYEPLDREEWMMTPITVNAGYVAAENSINILPGLIGDVLYNKDMMKEEIYANLGAVIGHEVSHGFDANGASYDEIGNYCDWWTEKDYENYEALTNHLVDYYNNITLWKDFNCNGELVKGEACADMAAVACLLRLASKDKDFDYDLFFRNYAQLWAAHTEPNTEYSAGMYDEHPLAYLRVNVVLAQFDEFYKTYDIKEGDGMYIAPEDRVKIW